VQADQTVVIWNNTRRFFVIASARRISPTEAMLGATLVAAAPGALPPIHLNARSADQNG
jgi:hypothetical protein